MAWHHYLLAKEKVTRSWKIKRLWRKRRKKTSHSLSKDCLCPPLFLGVSAFHLPFLDHQIHFLRNKPPPTFFLPSSITKPVAMLIDEGLEQRYLGLGSSGRSGRVEFLRVLGSCPGSENGSFSRSGPLSLSVGQCNSALAQRSL